MKAELKTEPAKYIIMGLAVLTLGLVAMMALLHLA